VEREREIGREREREREGGREGGVALNERIRRSIEFLPSILPGGNWRGFSDERRTLKSWPNQKPDR
jgi:hypothetical protein